MSATPWRPGKAEKLPARPGPVALPIGSIVVRPNGSNPRRSHRLIKVSNTRSGGRDWMNYARWLWLKHRGPIGPGLRVLHLDGDTMNDDLANLALGTAGDQMFLSHTNDPKMSERNREACRVGSAAHNRLRGRLRRLRTWLPTRWYPVDHAARTVLNRPAKNRWRVWADVVSPAAMLGNGRGALAAALGWPEVGDVGAVVLAALAGGRKATPELWAEVVRLRRLAGERQLWQGVRGLAQVLLPLRRGGWISGRQNGRSPAVYWLTDKARAARGSVSAYMPVRGADLLAGACGGYAKVEADADLADALAPRPVSLGDAWRGLALAVAGGEARP